MNKLTTISFILLTIVLFVLADNQDKDKRKILFEGLLHNRPILLAHRTSLKLKGIYDKNRIDRILLKRKLPVVYDTTYECTFTVTKVLSGRYKDTILNYYSLIHTFDSSGYCFVIESDAFKQPKSGFGNTEYRNQFNIGIEESIEIMKCFINNSYPQSLSEEDTKLITYLKTLKIKRPNNALNHDRPHLQTPLARQPSPTQARLVVCGEKMRS